MTTKKAKEKKKRQSVFRIRSDEESLRAGFASKLAKTTGFELENNYHVIGANGLTFSQFFGQSFGFGAPLTNFCYCRALLGVSALGLAPGPGPRERPTPRHQHTNTGLGRTGSSPPPGGRGRWRGSGAACARDQGAGSPTAPRSGAPGLPGGDFRTGIVTQREPRRSKIPAFGGKMRHWGPHTGSLAVGGYFRFRPVARRKDAAQLARFSSI